MAIAESLISKIIDELGEVAIKQLEKRVNLVLGVEEEVANIEKRLATIEKVLRDAERRRLKEEPVGIWLEELEDITCEMDDVLEEWNVKIQKPEFDQPEFEQPTLWRKVSSLGRYIWLRFKQLPDRSDIAQKIEKINERLELTLKEADQFKFITSGGVPDFQRIMTTSIIDESEVYGRTPDKDKVLDKILPESSSHISQGRNGIQVISIVGAGGTGKTTLAQLLFNDDRVKNHFELKKWVCVSDPFNEKRIVKAILESLGPDSSELESLELDPLIQRIKETFSNKRFLLVLDDVWTEDDSKWKPFQYSLKDGAPGSVILVTTRSHRVARVVGSTDTHRLDLISDSDCWLIMQRIAFARKSGDLCKKVERIGLKIAEKCKGLPLAAKTMGSLLRFKDTIQQWQNVLDSEIWQLEEAAVELFPHLYLSYNELSPELKLCFSYCAVFPKDHEIDVEELIRLWIAQGYVHPRRRGERLELVGHEYFNNLAMRSFFQEIGKGTYSGHEFMKCKMHDIVHDFARFLTKNECHVLDGNGRNLSSERARHLTILEGTEETFGSSVFDLGRLRSFFAFSQGRVPQDLFGSLNCVRTLTLSHCQLREVPTKVGSLVHLRHLDLSWNPFETLPEAICDLYYLETLDISYCRKLWCLPKRIEGLVHLKHLFNHNTYELLQMQQGLEELTSLCSLTNFIASNNSDDLAILKDLNQLERLYVDIHGKGDFGSAELGKKIYLREMLLRFSHEAHSKGTPSCIQTMEPPPNLQQLALVTYPGTQLPSWLVTKTLISSLTKLFIVEPRNISSLPTLWKLSSLEELRLEYVEELEYLGKEFFGITLSNFESSSSTEAVAFPNLRKLHFLKFPNWTNWEDLSEEDEKVVVSIMPRLEELEIEACDELKGLPLRILGKMSSLKSLKVQHCNKLRDRYSNKTGDDWLKISSRIPRIHISQY